LWSIKSVFAWWKRVWTKKVSFSIARKGRGQKEAEMGRGQKRYVSALLEKAVVQNAMSDGWKGAWSKK
jgi:hypothetical protein